MHLRPLPAFADNYIWTLADDDGHALVVDPGDAAPVLAASFGWNNVFGFAVIPLVITLLVFALLARNALWQEGVFGLITGFMEAGESPEAGICREVREETGLQARALRLLGCWEFLRMNQVLIAYHVRAEGEVRLSPELLEHRWVTPEQAQCWPAGTGYALAHWVQGKGLEPRFGAFRPGQNPEPDPAKWPLRPWADDTRFMLPPVL